MTTFSEKFDHITNSFPLDLEAIQRVKGLISPYIGREDSNRIEFSHLRLSEQLADIPTIRASKLINALIQNEVLVKNLRVTSEVGTGLAEYKTILDIPEVIHDQFIDREVEVTPERIDVIYKICRD